MASALVSCFDCVEGDCGAWKWVHGSRCVVSGCMEVWVRGRKPEGLLVCFGVAQLSDIAVYQICTVSVLSFSSAQKMLGFCAGTTLKEVQNILNIMFNIGVALGKGLVNLQE